MITIQSTIHFSRGRRTRKELREGHATPEAPAGRVPRLSRLMAPAIRLDQLLRDGHVADQAELARLGHVTRDRLTQIMNLLCLAPDVQEELLFLPVTQQERDAITEKQRWPIVSMEHPAGKQRQIRQQLWHAA